MKNMFVLLVFSLVVSCVYGATYSFLINSNPTGAVVVAIPQSAKIDNPTEIELGKTPLKYDFIFGKNGIKSYLIKMKLPGFADQTILLEKARIKEFLVKGNYVFKVDFNIANVSLISTPVGASVKVSTDSGLSSSISLGVTPLTFDCDFRPMKPKKYIFTFSLPNFEDYVTSVDFETLSMLLRNGKFVLEAKMVKLEVREIEKLVVDVSESQGYTIKRTKARSWDRDIEREGMAPTRILMLKENQTVSGMTLSPDDSRLYFSLAEIVLDDEDREKVVSNLRAISTNGGGVAQITSGQWIDSQPTCAKDGKYLIFNSNRLQHDKSDLYRIMTETTGGISVVRQTQEGDNYESSLGVGGVFTYTYLPRYMGQNSLPQIWTVGGDSAYPTQLRNGSMPAISPDGKTIAFIGDDRQLWTMNVNGTNLIQLTDDQVNWNGKLHPTWSPDGKYIVFASDVAKDDKDVANYDIWMISANGGMQIQLTTNGSEDDYPVVSNKQDYIYFSSNRVFNYGIWRIPFPALEIKE